MYMCACVDQVSSSVYLYLIFEIWGSVVKLYWSDIEPQDSACLHFPGSVNTSPCTGVFT